MPFIPDAPATTGRFVPDAPVTTAAPAKFDPSKAQNPFIRSAAESNDAIGAASAATDNAIFNTPHRVKEDVQDLAQGGIEKTPGPAHIQSPGGDVQPGVYAHPLLQRLAQLPHDVLNTLESNFGPTVADVARQGTRVAGDVGDLATVADPALRVGGAAKNLLTDAVRPVPHTVELPSERGAQYGLRNGDDQPIVRALAGRKGQDALTTANTENAAPVLAAEASHSPNMPMTRESMEQARAPANDVYRRVAQATPTAALNDAENAALDSIVTPKEHSVVAPDAAQAQIVAQREALRQPLSGDNRLNTMAKLRQDGYAAISSDDPVKQAVGRAQVQMAKVLEDSTLRSLPKNADVTPEQFLQARTDLAKNHVVEAATRNGQPDLQALARMHDANPEVTSGPLGDIAEFANKNQEVTQLPSKYNQNGSLTNLRYVHLNHPQTWFEPLFAPLLKRGGILPDAGDFAHNPVQPPVRGARLEPIVGAQRSTAYPALPPATMGPPDPSIRGPISGGSGDVPAAPRGLAEEFDYSPDVQRAGAQHPGAAPRSVQLHEPSAMEMLPEPPLHTQNWETGPVGVEPQATLEARTAALQGRNQQLGNVMSQGVPDGTMLRTPAKPRLSANDIVTPQNEGGEFVPQRPQGRVLAGEEPQPVQPGASSALPPKSGRALVRESNAATPVVDDSARRTMAQQRPLIQQVLDELFPEPNDARYSGAPKKRGR